MPEESNEKIERNEDVVAEDTTDDDIVMEDGEGNTEDKVKVLKEKLKKAIAEKQEYLNGWQRDKADFINARKRDEASRQEMIKFANENLLLELTGVLDSFTLAFNNKEAWEKVDKNWRVGVEYIYSKLKGVLEQSGFAEFDPKGEHFDPIKHHAIETVKVDDKVKDGMVLEVVQKGYTLHGKVVRPATVKIGEYNA